MATFAGDLTGAFALAPVAGLAAGLPQTTGLSVGPWESGRNLLSPIYGAFDIEQPTLALTSSFDGAVGSSYFDDYYNRIWIVPLKVDFGSIVADTSAPVYIWNAYLKTVTLSSFSISGLGGVTIGGVTAPHSIKRLGLISVTANVDAAGEPRVASLVNFDFGSDGFARLSVEGVRARLWDFPPNWRDGVQVSYEYSTEVITSESGKEQRRASRQTPRKSVTFNAIVNDGSFRNFIRHMDSWQGLPTIMIDYSGTAYTSVDTPSGGVVLSFSDAEPWMMAGAVVAIDMGDSRLLRSIASVVGANVTLSASIDGGCPAGTRVFPTSTGRIATQITARMRTNRTAVVGVKFSTDPGTETYPAPPSPSVMHRGREVFLIRPNWGSEISPEFISMLEAVDYGHGRVSYYNPTSFNTRWHKAEYLEASRQDVYQVEAFFRRQKGQRGEFFMPTFTEDLVIKRDVLATTATMRISGTETASDYATGDVYRDLIVFMNDGSYIMKHVQAIYPVEDMIGKDTIIQVTEPFSTTFTPDDVRQICWMPLWRLGSDSLTSSWVTDGAARITLNMKTLPYEDAEI